jgi:hypothetical protein
MRSAFLLSVVSVVILSLFGLVRSTPQEADKRQAEDNPSDEESTLFVG